MILFKECNDFVHEVFQEWCKSLHDFFSKTQVSKIMFQWICFGIFFNTLIGRILVSPELWNIVITGISCDHGERQWNQSFFWVPWYWRGQQWVTPSSLIVFGCYKIRIDNNEYTVRSWTGCQQQQWQHSFNIEIANGCNACWAGEKIRWDFSSLIMCEVGDSCQLRYVQMWSPLCCQFSNGYFMKILMLIPWC